MCDPYYDHNYEMVKKYERERTEEAIEKLGKKYARELSADYWMGGGRTPEARAALRSYGRSRAIEKLEELGREF
jgi:hypothetical protein